MTKIKTLHRFKGRNGFGTWRASARGNSEADAAQRVAHRCNGNKAGAYPTIVDGVPGWQIATPNGQMGSFRRSP